MAWPASLRGAWIALFVANLAGCTGGRSQSADANASNPMGDTGSSVAETVEPIADSQRSADTASANDTAPAYVADPACPTTHPGQEDECNFEWQQRAMFLSGELWRIRELSDRLVRLFYPSVDPSLYFGEGLVWPNGPCDSVDWCGPWIFGIDTTLGSPCRTTEDCLPIAT